MISLNNRLHFLIAKFKSKPYEFLLHFLQSFHLHLQQNSLTNHFGPFQCNLLQLITEDDLLKECFARLAHLSQGSVGQLYLSKQDDIEIIQFLPDFVQDFGLAHDHFTHFQEADVDHPIISIGKGVKLLQWFHYSKQTTFLPHLDDLRNVVDCLQEGVFGLLDTIELDLGHVLISIGLYLGGIGDFPCHMLPFGLDPFDLRIALLSDNRSCIMIPALALQLQC